MIFGFVRLPEWNSFAYESTLQEKGILPIAVNLLASWEITKVPNFFADTESHQEMIPSSVHGKEKYC